MGIFSSGGEDSKYSTTQKAVSFPISTLMSAFGSALFLLSTLLYYGIVEMTVVIPETHQIGFVGSFMLMFASLFMAVWTLDAMPVTFFGPVEWTLTAMQALFLAAPVIAESFWNSYPVIAPFLGLAVSTAFWIVSIRGAWDSIFGGG